MKRASVSTSCIISILLTICFYTTNLFSQTEIITSKINELSDKYCCEIGIMARDMKSGAEFRYSSREKFPTASVIKLPIMVEFFYQVSEGRIDSQSFVKLTDDKKWGGSGVLQYFNGSSKIRLIDAVTLMIIVSDNTATNLVIDALGKNHQEKLDAVNNRMKSIGLHNTRLLNKVMSWDTKTNSSESIRYGVGVSTPEDMATLLELIYMKELISEEYSTEMINILQRQQYRSMIPRYLPFMNTDIQVAHKGGSVSETKNDVGIIFSEKGDIVVSIFCDQTYDHRDSPENDGTLAVAESARLIWNYFTDSNGFDVIKRNSRLNWAQYPGGKWVKVDLECAPFPHWKRRNGYENRAGKIFSFKGHYDEGSAIIVIPSGWVEKSSHLDLIVHFHGHNNNVLDVMEQFSIPQQLLASRKNAILVLAQGPKNAPDSFGGKMEDENGFKYFVEEIMDILSENGEIQSTEVNRIIVSAHSGGYRPAAYVLDRGGLTEKIREVYLFDAFYAQHDKFLSWIKNYSGKMISIYTEHLADEHSQFMNTLDELKIEYATSLEGNKRYTFYSTDVCHNCVIDKNFQLYLKSSELDDID